MCVLSFKTQAQISPGELTTAHARFEGLSNCTKCHVLGAHVTSAKCLDCHTEIKKAIEANRGYHSDRSVKGKDCFKCHSEHHGRNFKIVRFNQNSFNHGITGFELSGKHTKAKCQDCHKANNGKNTFLGLSPNCISCHEDYHQKTLGENCLKCHNTNSFKPAVSFDHNQAKFKLIGAHISLACNKCHIKEKKNGRDFQRFSGLNFTNCIPCHKDIHQGRFGNDCRKCHSVSSFKNINKTAFDHSKTNFPLLGRHSLALCQDCHIKNDFTKKLSFAKCSDCHADYHKGEFAKNNIKKDCRDCHTVEGFRLSTFSIEEHNTLKFPLTGSHLAVSCQGCHYKGGEWHFLIESSKCINCHNNVHGSELTEKYLGDNRCENCHNDLSWKAVSFNHKQTDFELVEKHSEVQCRSCHYNESDKQFRFASAKSNCESCHQDIHQGQFREGESSRSVCLKCHTCSNWKPSGFNHEQTKFPLNGAHQNVPCISCHPSIQSAGVLYTKYKLADFKCISCHRA